MTIARSPVRQGDVVPGHPERDGRSIRTRGSALTTVCVDARRYEVRIQREANAPPVQLGLAGHRVTVLQLPAPPGTSDRSLHLVFAGLRLAGTVPPNALLVMFRNGMAGTHGENSASVQALAEGIERSLSATPINRRLVVHLALAMRALVPDDATPRMDALLPAGLADWQLRRALAFMNEHFAQPLRIPDVAAVCALSHGHFARRFQVSTGKTPYRWVLERRVQESQRLMTTTDMPLTEIAQACGFSEQSHFTRIFRNTVGVPPGSWRRSAAAVTWRQPEA